MRNEEVVGSRLMKHVPAVVAGRRHVRPQPHNLLETFRGVLHVPKQAACEIVHRKRYWCDKNRTQETAMNPSHARSIVVLVAALVLLLAVTIPLGVAIARSSELPLGPFTDHLFVLLTLAIVGCAVWTAIQVGRELKRRGALLRGIVFAIYFVVIVPVGLDVVFELFPRLIPQRVLANLPFGGSYFYPRGTATHEFRDDLGIKPKPDVFVDIFYVNDLVRYGQISPIYDYPTTHILYATDAQGFRNSDQATTADIVVLGDSFTELPYMQLEDVWPSLLARQTGWKVRNLAVSGYGTAQQAVVLRNWGLAYRPRVVVLAFYEGNDIFDCSEYDEFRRSGLPFSKWVVRRFSKRLDWFNRRPVVAILRMTLLPYQRIAERWSGESARTRALRRTYFNPIEFEAGGQRQKIGLFSFSLTLLMSSADQVRSQAGWPFFQDAVRDIEQACRSVGAALVVVYIPTKERVYLPVLRGRFTSQAIRDFVAAYHEQFKNTDSDDFEARLYRNMDGTEQAVREFCEQNHIPYFSLTPAFRRAAQEGHLIYFAFDCHWNREGNRIAAEQIEQLLRHSAMTAETR